MTDATTVTDPNPENKEADHQSLLLDETVKAPEAKPATPAPVVEEVGGVEYEPTGDVGLDMALQFVGKAGITQDHPAMLAAKDGDFTILRATLAAKGTPGWEQFVALGEAAYARVSKEAAGKEAANREAIYKEAGGKEEWTAVQTWASTNATPEEKQQINALLNQGGLAAKGAVKYLIDAYNRAGNVVVNPRDPLANAGRSQEASGANAPLSPRDYANAVQQLNNKLQGRLEGSKEYENLQKRRALYRA